MALRIELNGDKPGIVKFSASKWQHSADVEIMIQRNQDNFYLSQSNQWGPETSWHVITDLIVNDDRLEGQIGPWLTDSLLALGGNCKFLMQIRECNNPTSTDRGVITIKGNVLPSSAVSIDLPIEEVAVKPTQVESIIEPVAEPTTEAVTEEAATAAIEPISPVINTSNPEPSKKKGKGIIAMIVIIAILLIAALFAFLLLNRSEQPTKSTSDDVDTSSCALSQLGNNEMDFIQTCLRDKPSTEQILKLILEAKAQDKCNIAQRLYANQSQQNANIAIVYAKEYDDKFYQKNSCFVTDKDTAIYWYETALALDPNSDLAKTRLTQLKAQ